MLELRFTPRFRLTNPTKTGWVFSGLLGWRGSRDAGLEVRTWQFAPLPKRVTASSAAIRCRNRSSKKVLSLRSCCSERQSAPRVQYQITVFDAPLAVAHSRIDATVHEILRNCFSSWMLMN